MVFIVAGILVSLVILAGCITDPIMSGNQSGPQESNNEQTSATPVTTAHVLSHTIVLEKPLPKKVDTIMVYKTIPVHYTRQDIVAFAQKFNLSNTTKIKEVAEGSSIASSDGNIQAILHNSGFAEYHDSSRMHMIYSPESLKTQPCDNGTEKNATKFLKDHALLPEGAEFRGVSRDKTISSRGNGTELVFWGNPNVWYGRTLNNYPVEGTQLMLSIDPDGVPADFFTNWRYYKAYKELPVKSPEEAFEELKKTSFRVGMDLADNVSITDVYLAYHTKAGAETEYYLEPVWVFKGTAQNRGYIYESARDYVSALTEVPRELLTS
jgi:hypothetical protein